MPQGVRTLEKLREVVAAYMQFDEFVVDVETKGEFRGDPHRNDVFWISLAGPGRADAIPCGHPIGERIVRDETILGADGTPYYRIDPRTGKHQEHQTNATTGRLKWVNVPEPFDDPPEQLWVSDVIAELRPLFFSDRRIVGQNVKFDIESLAKYFGEVPPGPYGDTLVAAKLIDENHLGYSLDKLVSREFGFEYEKIGKKGPENFPYSEAYLYSFLDAKYTWLLWQKFVRQMDEQDVRAIFDMEMDLLPVLINMEVVGMPIDEEALAKLGEDFLVEMADIQVAIDRVAGTEVNLNANRQIAALVYDTLGHECPLITPSGERSTSRETLEQFDSDPVVEKVLDHAKLRKLQSTFVDGLQKAVHEGRVHPSLNQVGAVSGRLSCREPNIQQIPSRSDRGKRVRDVFVASPGHVLVVSDLSQIELRMLAHLTNDPTLKRAYKQDLDLHGLLAERVFGSGYTSAQRSLAKNAHFSVLYGAGPKTMVRKYQIPNERVAQQLLKGFYESYAKVKPWKAKVISDARAKWVRKTTPPYVTTILGRKRRLPDLNSKDEGKRFAAERQAISVTISGSAADLFKLVMIQCDRMLKEQDWVGNILMTVHDELIVEVPEEYQEEGLALVKFAMENVNNPYTGESFLNVPIVADAKIVKRWSDGK